jgi:SAM-dependent methyltransferase
VKVPWNKPLPEHSGPVSVSDTIRAVAEMYCWPSQSLWRFREVQILRTVEYQRPILEIGCGSGALSSLIFDQVEEAIDINKRSVEVSRRIVGPRGPLYGRVRHFDARDLASEPKSRFGTVFANCVVEHIPDLACVLQSCCHVLRSDGMLVITVPLSEMNNHMLLNARWYTTLRQRQLTHLNIMPLNEWKTLLQSCGFEVDTVEPYLFEDDCRYWDRWDVAGMIGKGRYRVATAAVYLMRRLHRTRAIYVEIIGRLLSRRAGHEHGHGQPCAALIVAHKC